MAFHGTNLGGITSGLPVTRDQCENRRLSRRLDISRPVDHEGTAFLESRKKMPRFEGRTGSLTWNKVRSEQARTARAANHNRPDSGVVRL
jgi:hypothetical protein